jgi:hypothetical protein
MSAKTEVQRVVRDKLVAAWKKAMKVDRQSAVVLKLVSGDTTGFCTVEVMLRAKPARQAPTDAQSPDSEATLLAFIWPHKQNPLAEKWNVENWKVGRTNECLLAGSPPTAVEATLQTRYLMPSGRMHQLGKGRLEGKRATSERRESVCTKFSLKENPRFPQGLYVLVVNR